MLRKRLIGIALCMPFFASLSLANEVVKWVDENGVTHFGNAQFAPPGSGEAVRIEHANGMDVPDVGVLNNRPKRNRINATVLQRPKLENPRGWRGFNGRSRGQRSRR